MATNINFPASLAAEHLDLTSLITTSENGDGAVTYPSEDTIAALLHARARSDHPYTRISPSGSEYIVLNPLRALQCLNEENRKAYQDDVERTDGGIGGQPRQPSAYELAGRVWLLMSRQRECQTVVFHGLTGSGKSSTSRHLVNQILELATTSKAQRRMAVQVNHMVNLLESFGNAKSALNPSASQHGRYLELHFSLDGAISGAKVLPFALNKSRVGNLQQDERTFHVFYQMLAGATPDERDELGLDDMDQYRLLASSNCYRLPAGPFSDDSTQLGELRASFAALGFKLKHVRSIFSVLTAILILSNLTFTDTRAAGSLGMTSYEEHTSVVERELLEIVSTHLGVPPEDLEAVLVNRTKWVSHDLASVFLDAPMAETQRDSLMRDLYAILFAFVVEMANKRLAPDVNAPPTIQIGILDAPGHQSRTLTSEPTAGRHSLLNTMPLINVSGQNGFEEFGVNFCSEIVHSYLLRRTFEDEVSWNAELRADGIRLPPVVTMDNVSCLELLRGGPLGPKKLARQPTGVIGLLADVGERIKGDERDDVKASAVVGHLTTAFAKQPSFIASPASGLGPAQREGRMFGVTHWAGQVSYDATDFIDHNADVLDKQLVELLRNSADPFITKLVSGPALSTECHPLDDTIVVEAQVSSTPLRPPTAIANRLLGSHVQDAVDYPIDTSIPQLVTAQLNATMATVFSTIDRTRVWGVHCIRPNDSGHPNSYDRRRIKAQVRALLIPDLVKRREVDYVAEYPLHQFCVRQSLPEHDTHRAVEEFAAAHGWNAGVDYAIGNERIWLTYHAWREQEDLLRSTETRRGSGEETLTDEDNAYAAGNTRGHSVYAAHMGPGSDMLHPTESMDNLLRANSRETGYGPSGGRYGYESPNPSSSEVWLTSKDEHYNNADPALPATKEVIPTNNGLVQKEKRHHSTEVVATSKARRWWIRITWLLTWWIPSILLRTLGGMKRPDVRMAWREKVAICMMIGFMCGVVMFWIIGFGKVICPEADYAWNKSQLEAFQGDPDYYVAIWGKVYDLTNFWKGDHSDISGVTANKQVMGMFAGQDLSYYFPPPMEWACAGLVNITTIQLSWYDPIAFNPINQDAIHWSGDNRIALGHNESELAKSDWFQHRFEPYLKQHYKGTYVFDKGDVAEAGSGDTPRYWAIYRDNIYDLANYIKTADQHLSDSLSAQYNFLNEDVTALFKQSPGSDITGQMDKILNGLTDEERTANLNCLNNAFYLGKTDFRKTARCTFNNYLLLAFAIVLTATVGLKFLAALQLTGKRNPELLDKFVICQVPCYTEGEESLKKTIDSLATLEYDDKRKLIFIICDGNIIGSGNNRPTPRIVLDILGVDPKLDPEPLIFKSIGDGSKQLNYGKIYSGLYEYEGHVVPYVVVVKVGKPSETSRPGNRGKRDSQVLLMQYLNRVHFDAPMCPLELEIYHQMRNVIGIDPTFYEYIFQVDADTTVTPQSLNRLISCTADDSKIIGICGETKLANERESFTTMIQVYEYFISHHLTKAFESLFGSVTCLPGCFSVYRIRTADKGRPLIISSVVIDEYAEPNVDTLHKKNLFSLGEDRYLTTLMMKHFPTYKMKFSADAIAHTVAPSRWNVLLSQRRRWINSTIHNLAELLFLPEMCGFCLFSMRFMVFIDLLGTIILPATFAYLIYLIVIVATHQAPLPVLSIALIAAVYGLQMIIFILKREFMLIGWMFVYLLAFPIYSVFLPLYSFWSMDDFSWGNTRQVVGEGNNKTVVYDDDEPFDDSMIPLRTFKEYEANAWETTSLPSDGEQDGVSQYTRTERSRRKRVEHRSAAQSSAPGSIYGGDRGGNGSQYSSRQPSPAPYFDQRMTMFSQPAYNLGYGNPFDSPAMSDAASLRPPMFAPYASPMGSPGFPMNPMAGRGSTYSLATSANPFGNNTAGGGGSASLPPNTDPSPTDHTVLHTLRTYLNTQDLMTVTKRSAREAIYGLFPNANLQDRAAWLNENIDKILSEV